MKKVTPAQHRKMLKKLSKQPFVMATSATLPYLPHLPPNAVIRAHKLIAGDMGPSHYRRLSSARPQISYHPGRVVNQPNANTGEYNTCGVGLHVGTVEWCKYCYTSEVSHDGLAGLLLSEVEFRCRDVAAFPRRLNIGKPMRQGKFRLHRLKVLSVRVLTDAEVETASLRSQHDSRQSHRHKQQPMLDAAIFEPKRKKAGK